MKCCFLLFLRDDFITYWVSLLPASGGIPSHLVLMCQMIPIKVKLSLNFDRVVWPNLLFSKYQPIQYILYV